MPYTLNCPHFYVVALQCHTCQNVVNDMSLCGSVVTCTQNQVGVGTKHVHLNQEDDM